jgi:DNA-binding transcriptional regulator YdaS (Cro superfamily)
MISVMEIMAGMDTPLKAWRIATERTLKDVAAEACVTEAMWSRWENGKRAVPAERVLDIERMTGISRHQLCPGVFGERETAA